MHRLTASNSPTAHQLRCCMHRLKRSRKGQHSPGPHRKSHCSIGAGRCRRCEPYRPELSTMSSWQLVQRYTRTVLLLLWTEFDIAQLQSRHDARDSPRTLGIRVPPPLASGRDGVRELRAPRQHVLGDGGGGSILTASPFSFVRVWSGYQ